MPIASRHHASQYHIPKMDELLGAAVASAAPFTVPSHVNISAAANAASAAIAAKKMAASTVANPSRKRKRMPTTYTENNGSYDDDDDDDDDDDEYVPKTHDDDDDIGTGDDSGNGNGNKRLRRSSKSLPVKAACEGGGETRPSKLLPAKAAREGDEDTRRAVNRAAARRSRERKSSCLSTTKATVRLLFEDTNAACKELESKKGDIQKALTATADIIRVYNICMPVIKRAQQQLQHRSPDYGTPNEFVETVATLGGVLATLQNTSVSEDGKIVSSVATLTDLFKFAEETCTDTNDMVKSLNEILFTKVKRGRPPNNTE